MKYTSYIPDLTNWNSLYSIKNIKVYLGIYLFIILISYFGKTLLPKFWTSAISNKRVKGKFCESIASDSDKSTLKEWSGCLSCDTGCSCKNCPISFKRYLFRRVLIPVYLYLSFMILKYLGMSPILKPLGLIGSFICSISDTWFPIILALCVIIPLFRIPLKTQYIFIGSDKKGFKQLDNSKNNGPYICGDASSIDSTVVGLGKAKNYFATGCSVNTLYLVLYSLIPLIIIILIFCLIVFLNSKKEETQQKYKESFIEYDD